MTARTDARPADLLLLLQTVDGVAASPANRPCKLEGSGCGDVIVSTLRPHTDAVIESVSRTVICHVLRPFFRKQVRPSISASIVGSLGAFHIRI